MRYNEDELASCTHHNAGSILFEREFKQARAGADNCGIDLAAAMMIAKMEINEQSHPVEKPRGSNAKYNEL
jgi:hypothetical protein